MLKKITFICIILMYLSNTEAFLNDLLNAIDYVNPLTSAPKTALRGLEDELSEGKHGTVVGDELSEEKYGTVPGDELSEEKHNHHDINVQIDEIQDDFTLQKAILLVRLKAAKRFQQSRSDFLKYTEDDHWEVNETIISSKRYDLEVAKNDVKIIEEALENPSEFKDLF